MFSIHKTHMGTIQEAMDEFKDKDITDPVVWAEVISRLTKSQNDQFDKQNLKILEVQAPDQEGQVRLHFSYGSIRFLPITGDKRITIERNVASVTARAVSSILSILQTFHTK